MQKPIKVGLAGYGMAAQVMHLPFLTTSPYYQVVSVLERHHDHSQEKYPFVKIVRTIDELVADPGTDLIVITTPNETHFPYAQKALLAGKHVVVEKPFTITTEEAGKLIGLAKETARTLSVFQTRRYASDFLTIKKIMQEGLLGEIIEFEAHYDRYRPGPKPNAWREEARPGSGIFYDLGAHLLDQALYLFGLPQAITADIRLQRSHAKADDYFDVWLDYGLLKVTLKAGMLVREPGPRYLIHGARGSYIKSGEDPQEALLKAGSLPDIPHWGEEPPEQWGLLHIEKDGKSLRERYPSVPGNNGLYYQHLAETLLQNAPLRERPEQSFNNIRLIELAIESSRGKRTLECTGLIPLPAAILSA
jgi:scyllo-inositol 2-dehydrogenase (NADP+)